MGGGGAKEVLEVKSFGKVLEVWNAEQDGQRDSLGGKESGR